MGSVQYWEDVADRTWGRYIVAAETDAITEAQAAAPPPKHALDVGCGGGRWTDLLLEHGWSVTAVDVDPEALATCAGRNPAAEPVLVDPHDETLAAADHSVAVVVCIEVLPVTHSDWFCREASRVLVPGGRLVTVAWNRSSLRGRAAGARRRLREGRQHEHYQTSYRPWRRRLVEAGFRIEAERGLCWFPFGRASDSRLVPFCVAVERRLGLCRLPALSPWVLVTAVRGTTVR
nr:class I SAM-dependent methyltransferase [Geodermatophilus sabuli]